jgi:glycosyltransferase involved in cell wall biosynthesis
VNDGAEGILVQPREPHALAAAIERCARSPDMCVAMGAAGRRRIETSFNSNISASAIVNAIRQRQSDRSIGAQLDPTYSTAAT